MQISFHNARGSHFIRFTDGKNPICQLYRSSFQPEFGYRLEMLQDVTFNNKGRVLSGTYHILKVFTDANSGIDYVHANFDSLVEKFNEQIA